MRPVHIGCTGQQNRLDLERGQFRVLGPDQGDNPGNVGGSKTVAGADHVLLVIPGHFHIDAGRPNPKQRAGGRGVLKSV